VLAHVDLMCICVGMVCSCAFLLEFIYGLCVMCVRVQFPPLFTFFQGVSNVLEGSEDYLNTVISVGGVFP
jgi:hypothetical protein